MTEYLVFPIPDGLVKVEASNPQVARNKYVKEMSDYMDEALIIIPLAHGNKQTDGRNIIPLWKCNIPQIGVK